MKYMYIAESLKWYSCHAAPRAPANVNAELTPRAGGGEPGPQNGLGLDGFCSSARTFKFSGFIYSPRSFGAQSFDSASQKHCHAKIVGSLYFARAPPEPNQPLTRPALPTFDFLS